MLDSTMDWETKRAWETVAGAEEMPEESQAMAAKRIVLERFWPVGRESFFKHRPIKVLYGPSAEFKTHQLYAALRDMKRDRLVVEPILKSTFLELNTEMLPMIRSILGRGQ